MKKGRQLYYIFKVLQEKKKTIKLELYTQNSLQIWKKNKDIFKQTHKLET